MATIARATVTVEANDGRTWTYEMTDEGMFDAVGVTLADLVSAMMHNCARNVAPAGPGR